MHKCMYNSSIHTDNILNESTKLPNKRNFNWTLHIQPNSAQKSFYSIVIYNIHIFFTNIIYKDKQHPTKNSGYVTRDAYVDGNCVEM